MNLYSRLRREIRLAMCQLEIMYQDAVLLEARALGVAAMPPDDAPAPRRREKPVPPPPIKRRSRARRPSAVAGPAKPYQLRWPLGMPEDLEHPLNQSPESPELGSSPLNPSTTLT